MLTLNLKSSLADLAKDTQREQQQMRVAAQRGINAAARGLITDTVAEMRRRYPKLKAGDVRAMMQANFASVDSLRATITARSYPLGLMRFVVGSTRRKKGGGITVQIKNGTKLIPGAFVALGRNFGGGRSPVVFIRDPDAKRTDRGTWGIKALRTINVPDAMNVREVRQFLNESIHRRFDTEYTRQIRILAGRRDRIR